MLMRMIMSNTFIIMMIMMQDHQYVDDNDNYYDKRLGSAQSVSGTLGTVG